MSGSTLSMRARWHDVRDSAGDSRQIANGLGLFSIALGLAELLAPRRLSRTFDTRHAGVYQLAGVREIAAGVGLLAAENKAPWLWARTAGDAMDLAILGVGIRRQRPGRTAAALLAVLGIAALDLWCARKAS